MLRSDLRSADSVVLYAGVSMIDNRTPIVVIATGLRRKSANRKTGAMVQTWIIRADMLPTAAAGERADAGICGGCPHRKQLDGSRSCYVNVGQAPQGIYRAYVAGSYPVVQSDAEITELLAGRMVRLGAYGDPAAVPVSIWDAALAQSAGHTGYSHQWKSERLRGVTRYVQASVDSVEEAHKAVALGLGYFRVKAAGTAMLEGETYCPADSNPGVVTCATCRACSGRGARIVIDAHGSGAKHVARRMLPVL